MSNGTKTSPGLDVNSMSEVQERTDHKGRRDVMVTTRFTVPKYSGDLRMADCSEDNTQ